MKFDWKWLIGSIIIFAAAASSNRGGYGKWIFALVMVGVLLAFHDKFTNVIK